MIRELLVKKIEGALLGLGMDGVQWPRPEITDTKQPEHGHYACNIAMVAAKQASMAPPVLAKKIAESLRLDTDSFQSIEVAGPGFLNLRLTPAYLHSALGNLLEHAGNTVVPVQESERERINVEFVSVNPNGPITIGSGRGAAYGSTLCNVLAKAGHAVHREYYINDGVNSEQMRLFAESVKALAHGDSLPEKGYRGDYVQAVADQIGAEDQPVSWYQSRSQELMLQAQRTALTSFGVEFDTWFSEQSLHDSGQVASELDVILNAGVADEQPIRRKLILAKGGKIEDVEVEPQTITLDDVDEADSTGEGQHATVWLRSTKFGDDMDRVLRRRDGRLTYISSDIAYHWDKFNRPANATKLITILGPDHHGYIGRLQAVLASLLLAKGQVTPAKSGGDLSEIEAKLYSSPADRDASLSALHLAKSKLTVQIYQLVRFMKDGQPAPMRKRDGNIYALIDLINEIGEKMRPDGSAEDKLAAGRDVARFFYLMRSHDTTFDFDLNLAETKSDENPVFYVQYAHARICSILRKAEDQGLEPNVEVVLQHEREFALIMKLCDLGNEVHRTAQDYAVHRLVNYAIELARTFHSFYDACRVIDTENIALTTSRLALCRATRDVFREVFELLGVSAPESM